jgi:hypothetical protein
MAVVGMKEEASGLAFDAAAAIWQDRRVVMKGRLEYER